MRVATIYLAGQADRDDVFQDTFLKYAQSGKVFESGEHKKAWLIRVASNCCKDCLRKMKTRAGNLDDIEESGMEDTSIAEKAEESERAARLANALRSIEEKYRTVLYLKYYEGYTAAQIADLLEIPENTVYTNLSRGKDKLKEVLTHDEQGNG